MDGANDRPKTGLDDPRAVDILTTEHWSLLTSRTLGYQEIFGRTTIFVAILSATIVALALMAQATQFSPVSLLPAMLLMTANLFIGLMTFARAVAINYEDARWVAGMDLLRHAYLKIVPESDLAALFGQVRAFGIASGAAISIVSTVLHVVYAARYRQRHAPSQ